MSAAGLAMARRHPPDTPLEWVPPVSNARLAMLVLVTGESMLFAGLIGMYLVFRLSARTWPPADLPRLPLGVTALNTLVLFASLVPVTRALRAIRSRTDGVARGVAVATVLGLVFLGVQGAEWVQLVRHGLTLQSGSYGAAFYVLIGCHALHVLVAVGWLAVVAWLAARGRFTPARHTALEMSSFYWYFVCVLWAVLFPLVYLY